MAIAPSTTPASQALALGEFTSLSTRVPLIAERMVAHFGAVKSRELGLPVAACQIQSRGDGSRIIVNAAPRASRRAALNCVRSPAPPPVMIVPPMPATIAPPNGLGELAGGRRLIDRNAIGRHRGRAGHRKQTERESG